MQTVQKPEIPQHSFFLRLLARPLLFNDRCLGLDSAEKLLRFRSCSRCSSWRFLTRPLFL